MHCGRDNDTDGWWLARFDHPAGGRGYTACSGIRADEMLAGGKQQMPPLEKLLDTYRPQIAVYMLGTNDVSAGRSLDAYQADVEKSLDLMIDRGIIPILSTIPPHPGHLKESKAFNDALRTIARRRGLPLIDFEREILVRRPERLERHADRQRRRPSDGRAWRRDRRIRADGGKSSQQRLFVTRLAVGRKDRRSEANRRRSIAGGSKESRAATKRRTRPVRATSRAKKLRSPRGRLRRSRFRPVKPSACRSRATLIFPTSARNPTGTTAARRG